MESTPRRYGFCQHISFPSKNIVATIGIYIFMYPLVHFPPHRWPFIRQILPSPLGNPCSSMSPLYHPDLPHGVLYGMPLTTELQLAVLARLETEWEPCLHFPDSSASHQWQRSRMMFHPFTFVQIDTHRYSS